MDPPAIQSEKGPPEAARISAAPPKKAAPEITRSEAAQYLSIDTYVTDTQTKHQADLSRLLIGGLFVTIVLHYAAVICFVINKLDTRELSAVFNGWLPVLSGFAGSAVTYYFTRPNDQKK
jgi:hypothetical protein